MASSCADYDNLVPAVTLHVKVEGSTNKGGNSGTYQSDYNSSNFPQSCNEITDQPVTSGPCCNTSRDPAACNPYKSECRDSFQTHGGVTSSLTTTCETVAKHRITMGNFLFIQNEASTSDTRDFSDNCERDQNINSTKEVDIYYDCDSNNSNFDSTCDKTLRQTAISQSTAKSPSSANDVKKQLQRSTETVDYDSVPESEEFESPTETEPESGKLTFDSTTTQKINSVIVCERSPITMLTFTNKVTIPNTGGRQSDNHFSAISPHEHENMCVQGLATETQTVYDVSFQETTLESSASAYNKQTSAENRHDIKSTNSNTVSSTNGEFPINSSPETPTIVITPSTPKNKPLTSPVHSGLPGYVEKKRTDVRPHTSEPDNTKTKNKKCATTENGGRTERESLSSKRQNLSDDDTIVIVRTEHPLDADTNLFSPRVRQVEPCVDASESLTTISVSGHTNSTSSGYSAHKNDGRVKEASNVDSIAKQVSLSMQFTNKTIAADKTVSSGSSRTAAGKTDCNISSDPSVMRGSSKQSSQVSDYSELRRQEDSMQCSLVPITRCVPESTVDNTWGDYAELSESSNETTSSSFNGRTARGQTSKSMKDETSASITKYTKIANTGVVNNGTSSIKTDVNPGPSHYKTIIGYHESTHNQPRIVNVSTGRERTHETLRGTSSSSVPHRVIKIGTENEAEYAIPLPKSQRKTQSPGLAQNNQYVPHLPPRSPTSNARFPKSDHRNEHFEEPKICDQAGLKCQVKKSTTFGVLRSISDQNDYSNVPKFGRYDCFSLGRQPKRPISNTLRDSKGIALSLDILLRIRKQSLSDISNTTITEQTLSVEDILRSCSEFEQSNASYRNRTNSDSAANAYLHSLSFAQVANFRNVNPDVSEKCKPEVFVKPSKSGPIIEKYNNGDLLIESPSILKSCNHHGISNSVRITKYGNVENTEQKVGHKDWKALSEQQVNNKNSKNIESKGQYINSGNNKTINGSKTLHTENSVNENRKLNGCSQLSKDTTLEIRMEDMGIIKQKIDLPVSETTELAHVDSTIKRDATKTHESVKLKTSRDLKISSDNIAFTKPRVGFTTREQPVIEAGNQRQNSDKHSEITSGYQKSNSDTKSEIQSNYHKHNSGTKSEIQTRYHRQDSDRQSEIQAQNTDNCVIAIDTVSLNAKTEALSTSKDSPIATDVVPPRANRTLEMLPGCHISDRHRTGETISHASDLALTKLLIRSPETKIKSPLEKNCEAASNEMKSPSPDLTDSNVNQRGNMLSSSDPGSPVSPVSAFSDSTEDSSSEVMSALTVDVFTDTNMGDSTCLSQGPPNYHAKLEASEAIKWLRAAGFPQYAQMFDDGQFPTDLRVVERDHDFLDKDSLDSLFRRLETLNKYAGIKLDVLPCKKGSNEEEDEDDICALSDRWEYEKSARRWSRKNLVHPSQASTDMGSDQKELATRSCSHDSLLADQESEGQSADSPHSDVPQMPHSHDGREGQTASKVTFSQHIESDANLSPFLASERIKPHKNLLTRMEGLKSKKLRRPSSRKNIVKISNPIVDDTELMRARLERLHCVDITPKLDSSTPVKSPVIGHKISSSSKNSNPLSDNTKVQSFPASSQSSVSAASDANSSLTSSPENLMTQSITSRYKDTSLVHHSTLERQHSARKHSQQPIITNQQPYSGVTTEEKSRIDNRQDEVFLVPQDYQPGRFPQELHNSSTTTTPSDPPVSPTIRRFQHSSSDDMSELRKDSSLPQKAREVHSLEHRKSLYDNMLSVDDQGEEGELTMIFPGIYKVESCNNITLSSELSASLTTESTETAKCGSTGNSIGEHCEQQTANISHESSTTSVRGKSLDQIHTTLVKDRSVKFNTLPHASTPRVTTSATEAGKTSKTEISSPDWMNLSLSRSRAAYHSDEWSSLGSCSDMEHSDDMLDCGSRSVQASISHSGDVTVNSLQQDYDDFDRILQQLYQNINDLSSFMDIEKIAHAEPTRETCDSQDFDVQLDLDHENSFSGGESSNTAESGSEDQELGVTSLSQDDGLDQISEVSMERRDSGVGHSLTRSPRDQRRKKIRWHSFQKSHRPDVISRAMQINSLSVTQLVRLQKLSVLKLTSIMEKCLPVSKSGWNWMMPRFMKKQRTPDFSNKNVFGVPLSLMAQWTGQPLPQCVLYAMRYLRRTSPQAIGIFRKSGVKSKIQQLIDELEARPDIKNFEGANAYNVADMLKTYFRDLPECLLTNKMSEIFCSIYMHVPQSQRLEAIQTAIALLPDVNREVLQSILLFLSDISSHEAEHQMNASNLAVCFTPTVFHLGAHQNVGYSPKRNHKASPGIPDPREIMEQKAAHECLLMMITECKKLFTVPPSLFQQLQLQTPTPIQDIGNSPSDIRAFGQERIQIVLKEAHDKNRGWVPTFTFGDVDVFHRKPMDDCLLKEWKLVVDIEAPPIEVLHRIMHERHVWDEDLLSWSVVEQLDPHSDIFQFTLNSMAPHPFRHFCVLRYWRSDLNKGACALITKSVDHMDAMEAQGATAVDLGTYFLMEPCGSGRSRLTYLTRVDTRGRTPEWYTKIFSHISANFLKRLKESFKQFTSGPETRV